MTDTAPARLSTADTVFYLSNRPTMVGVLVFEDRGDIEQAEVEGWLAARLDRSPILTHRLVPVPGFVDHPRWVRAEVDITRHVSVEQHTDAGWDALGEKLVRMTAEGLRRDVPPWKISVFTDVTGVEGFPERAVVVALRVHHSVTDGLGFVHLLRSIFGESATTEWQFGPSAPWWIAAPIRFPALLARMGWVTARRRMEARRLRDVPVPTALRPRTRLNGSADGGRAHRFLSFTVSEFKSTAKALGEYTINDVVVAIVAGAQRSYIEERGELPDFSLAVHVPLSLRAGGPPVGNRIAAMIVDLHTDLSDPRARLEAIAESAGRERARVTRSGPAHIAFLNSIPAPILRLLSRPPAARPVAAAEVIRHPNTIVSNVPRGAANLAFLGIPVQTTVSFPEVVDGRGVGHVATSIGDALTLAVSCDTGMMPDLDHYMELIAKEYATLRALV
ncbi:WS/DGAT domain-containing protein [Rhodococcus sp. PAM 2766]|uniref:diacylglycerol O-acyltransferase n=1 Tax=Rhodococcus parequi TaxID=3137122 RepID=A0ABW9FBJ8_9NOCA